MYFVHPGKENTERVLQIAAIAAKERNLEHILVASNTGATAQSLRKLTNTKIICITHAYGYPKVGQQELSPQDRESLLAQNIQIVTAGHALSGAERGISRKFGGVYPVELIANTLRMFGQGTKVCVEIGAMAMDAGTISYGEKVIAIGGTARGADTAILLTPSYSADILDTKIHEILCKPFELS